MKLIAISVIPVILIFLIAIASQQIALQYTQKYVNRYGENIFQNQIKFSIAAQSFISFRLSREIYKIPFYISWLNQMHEKLIQGEFILDTKNNPSMANAMLIYQSKLAPELDYLIKKNQFYINSWYQQNATQIEQLDKTGQQIVYNISRLIPFLNIVKYQSKKKQSNILSISYQQVNIFTAEQGIFITHYVNNSLSSKLDSDDCFKGQFVYDPRCRFFYISSINQTSIFMNPPKFSVASTPPYLSQYTCQMARKFNQKTQKLENNHIQCIEAMLSNIYDYFQNIIKSSKQYYVIDPRSLSIYFNSKKEYNYSVITKADNFYNIELQYLQDQDEANKMMSYIQDNYNKWVFSEEKYGQVSLLQMFDLSKQITIMDYKRNGTTYKVIFNPVIQYDQIPKFMAKNTQKQGLLLEYAYLQINIISDEDLKEEKNKLLRFFSKFFFYVQITIGVVSLSFLIITVYYALLIKRLITNPIIRMTETLEEINQLKEFVDISEIIKEYEQKQELIFLSKETQMLYQSFLDLFEMIQYTSESFFIENEGQTLISLSKKVEFFTKFGNYSAAGVTHNNIGNILLNQQHFFQALEHFSLAAMYAKYELSAYFKKNPDSLYYHLFSQYSFIEQQEELQNQSSRINSFSQKIVNKKPSISKQRQFSQEKRISHDIQEITTSVNFIKNTSTPGNAATTKTHFSKSKKEQKEKKQSCENINELNNIKIQRSISMFNPNKQVSYIQNTNKPEYQLKQNEDKFQIQELIQNLFYRQQNYVISLAAFQESLNSQNQKSKLKYSYNFWKEIKSLLFEQQKLLNYLPEIQNLRILLICMISKCYYNQFKNKKAKLKFQEAAKIIQNLEKINEQKQNQSINQLENSPIQKDNKMFELRQNIYSKYDQYQQLSDTPKMFIFQSQKIKQQQKNMANNLDKSEILNNSSINIKLFQNNNIDSLHSVDSSQKILVKNLHFLSSPSKNQKDKNFVTKNESEQKINLQKSQFIEKIIQKQQNKLLEISQSINLDNKVASLQSINQYLQYNRSEYYIFIKKYRKAAEILTQLYENSQTLSSNVPFRIIFRIKQIFDIQNIYEQCLYEEYSRFNKNLSFEIAISLEFICDSNNNDNYENENRILQNQTTPIVQQNSKNKNQFKKQFSESQIKLLNELSMKVLTKDYDKICFYLVDKEEKSIKQVIDLIDNKQFRFFKNSIFEELNILDIQILSNQQKQNQFLDQSPPFNQSNSQLFQNVIESQIIEDQKVFEEYFDNNQQFLKANQKKFLISDLKFLNKQSSLETSILNESQNKNNQQSNDQILEADINQKLSQKFQESNQISQELKKENQNLNTKSLHQQITTLNKLITEYFIHLFSKQNTFSEELQNAYFYDFISKAIDQLFSQKLAYKISENQINQEDKSKHFYFYKQFISKELDGLEQFKFLKFIIYQTKQIQILKDTLFLNLCSVLASINTQIIIFLTEKGSNFLEQIENKTFIYQNKEVIKIFYNYEEIIQYLNFKRNNFSKYTYYSFIQYY